MPTDWKIGTLSDITNNDSDKMFTVPNGEEWEIMWIWVDYTSTSTSGSRLVEVQLQTSGSDIMSQWQTGVTQEPSLTYKYLFGVGSSDLESVRDSIYITTPMMASLFLSAGQKIRVWDNEAVDASADDMSIYIQYSYRDI